ncbi:hypothetical protein Poly30_30010 [Planctomycetes bacterium Poly30]|uniref:YprB ribonuclease H-like domain-containing protein n=1 Tax=Saltatorellus ferox TaxID=2528018 RepID=A0A518ETS5_9BACT|nr:hypothetical protein Poly30_30010 [Planctomycetes bacterium Poly30]
MAKDAFKSKLARLRRDGAVEAQGKAVAQELPQVEAAPAATERAKSLPAWVGARLSRRKELQGIPHTGGGVPMTSELQRIADSWDTTVGDPAELRVIQRAEGEFAVRETRIEPGYRHGEWDLDEIDAADPAAIARLARDEALGEIDLRRAVFLDTETSGLSGGAGVYVYMVGLGWFEGDTYVSWQSFLRHPGEERAMLAEVADRIRMGDSVVSFFGKSFDRHRLEDKMKIAGVEPPFEGRPHLDLYHPFRRLTHGAYPNAKLQTMERELLGFRRAKDLPGSLAPAAWFDYLAERPHRLEGVFLHNHEDVLSLVTLSAFLGRAVAEERRCGSALAGPTCRRAAALAETATTPEERLRWAQEALVREATGMDRRRMQLLRAELLRRAARRDEARAAYREALEECSDDRIAVDLFAGASMLLEHALGDLTNALAMAERAQRLGVRKGLAKGQLGALEKRVERLARRVP